MIDDFILTYFKLKYNHFGEIVSSIEPVNWSLNNEEYKEEQHQITPEVNTKSLRVNLDLNEISERLELVSERKDDWDEYGSPAPNQLAVYNATKVLEQWIDRVYSENIQWFNPYISSDEEGYITLEWYNGNRELHIEIREDYSEYLKCWGIENKMLTGELRSEDYISIWEWLINEQ